MSQLSPTWSLSTRTPFWLVVDGVQMAGAWRARTSREKRIGLLGTDGLTAALWIERCSSVHSFGMRYALDLGFLDRAGRVLATATLERSRLGLPRLRAHSVLEAPAGRLRDWRVVPGAVLSLVDWID